jgi:hypothetical protein
MNKLLTEGSGLLSYDAMLDMKPQEHPEVENLCIQFITQGCGRYFELRVVSVCRGGYIQCV